MDEQKVTQMKPTEAVKFLKRQRGQSKAIFVYCGHYANIEGSDKVFPIGGNAKVTLGNAVKFVKDSYSGIMESRGALVKITELGRCIFIG